jgi:hypothetical protein
LHRSLVLYKYFSGIRTEQDVPAIDTTNATSEGTGSTEKEEREKTTPINLILLENMIVFGAWPVFLYVPHKRLR